MPASIITFDTGSNIGRAILGALQKVRDGRQELACLRAVLIQMRNGNGEQAAHYAIQTAKAGYQAEGYADANTAAKASFDELDSLISKLATDEPVSAVMTALDQCCAKHGI